MPGERPRKDPLRVALFAKRARDVVLFVSGFTGALENILDMGFAALTAPLAALCPSLPAAAMGSLYVGSPHTHVHPPSLIPPAPPVPLPSLGSVLLGNCTGVLLCGIPAARAGDKGIAPTCGGITPFFDIKLGSSNVFIGGKRAARIGDMCECCKPSSPLTAGAAAMAVLGMTAGTAAQAAADAAALIAVVADPAPTPSKGAIVLPTAPLVLIGGFPMCPTLEFAKAVLGKIKALAKKKTDAPDPHAEGTGR